MTAADRTAIRSRLAIRGAADGPPGRLRKSWHHAIVPPLAAAAALVGIGVAAALARTELRRRAARLHGAEDGDGDVHTPGRPGTASADAQQHPRRRRQTLQHQTVAQLDLAIALLEGHTETPAEQTVHETRKALKRARALVRVQRTALGRERFRRENVALRDAGRALAVTRDAEVVLDALDALVRRHAELFSRSAGVHALHARLHAERERAWEQMRYGAQTRSAVLAELRASRARIARRSPAGRERRATRAGVARIYRERRARGRRARRTRSSEALHDWRKRVKDLRYAAEALERRPTARRADRLGETIGTEHDLTLLAARVRAHGDCFAGERATHKALVQTIARRRKRLRRRALRIGERLYAEKPQRFARRLTDV